MVKTFIKKHCKKIILIGILLALVIVIINQDWIDVEMSGEWIPEYHFKVKLDGRLVVTKKYLDYEADKNIKITHSKFLSINQLSQIIKLASQKVGEEGNYSQDANNVYIRIGWKKYEFAYGLAQNDNLNELLYRLVEYSPIKIVYRSGDPVKTQ